MSAAVPCRACGARSSERPHPANIATPGVICTGVARWACCGGRYDDTHTADCPILTPNEPYVLGMLLGIRREMDQWPRDAEHRCYSRLGWMRSGGDWICTCGSKSLVDNETQYVELLLAFDQLFECRSYRVEYKPPLIDRWHARPGTSITRGTG